MNGVRLVFAAGVFVFAPSACAGPLAATSPAPATTDTTDFRTFRLCITFLQKSLVAKAAVPAFLDHSAIAGTPQARMPALPGVIFILSGRRERYEGSTENRQDLQDFQDCFSSSSSC